MSASACYVIGAAEFQSLIDAFFLIAALAVILSVNWTGWYDRIERFLWLRARRRRLAFIRARKSGVAA